MSSPTNVLTSKLVSRVKGTDVIEGGYNFVHTSSASTSVNLTLHFPLFSAFQSTRIQSADRRLVLPSVACCTVNGTPISTYPHQPSTRIAARTDRNLWLWNTLMGIMRSMRTKTRFRMIGEMAPDGSACPLVDGMDGGTGEVLVDSFGLYNTGPYKSVREYLQGTFDRRYHSLDRMLHKGTLPVKLKEEMSSCLSHSNPEEIFERVNRLRDKFKANLYDCKCPFVLRHGDLHGRNVIVSRCAPRRILGSIDWDFGGSYALPFVDDDFELAHPDRDQGTDERVKQAEELSHYEFLLHLVGKRCSPDAELSYLMTRGYTSSTIM